MRYRVARFRVRSSEVAAAEKAMIAFVSKVADEPGTLRYESFREADGISYLHFMMRGPARLHRSEDGQRSRQVGYTGAISRLRQGRSTFFPSQSLR